MIREEQERALLAGAKAFLASETGVLETARRLSGLDRVRPELREDVAIFVGVDSETDAFPLGDVRKLWNPDALAALDPKIAAAAERYRDRIRAACERIVRRLEA